ncbi:hypothetical protein HU200_045833 [Digitaria exilis]|uniref:pectinesterase n=1 Tax=Digitaria exilis TaxID=1010633 RepID=A0A835AYW7_9POAL|nr:hypothetical protein HU200_045833 [Digitaria exilis]
MSMQGATGKRSPFQSRKAISYWKGTARRRRTSASTPTRTPASTRLCAAPNAELDEYSPTFLSATFTVLADNFVARDISFKNTYRGQDMSKQNQAVAALVGGDKSAFYGCEFDGFQDTLCDFKGRHYFRRCVVRGGVDFVFGYGQSIYEDCVLASVMPPGTSTTTQQPGWVTAHARLHAGSPGGMVFKGGAVTGTGRIYLGRAWNGFATVVFYGTRMDDVVVPQGWEAWNAGNDMSHVTFAEVGCTGAGSDMSRREGWVKHLSEEEVKRFVDMKFIGDGWLSIQP